MSSISQRFGNLSPLKQALLALEEMGVRLAKSENERHEPIAIIGIGCRFPGAANPDAFWTMMENRVDAVREVPPSRWPIDDFYDPDPDAPGKMSTRWAGLLDEVDQFDPDFFRISPREAVAMDPQQRILLEVAWEALENAGQGPRALALGQTGVFIGMTGDEYAQLFYDRGDPSAFNAYFASGIARSVAAGRISYVLGLQGPNLSLDTACSSSLVAVHSACLHLRMGECRVALAGGSNVVLSPEIGIAFSKAHMMAPDGRCKAFDARADGFVRGEGCGIVVLKRLSDAVADADNILAVIRGSSVNQDGRSGGLTVPNGKAQEAVIRQALANGGVQAGEIGYVEAHGTGTSLGDPIEAHALAAVLGPGRAQENPLVVGSVKTNVGHLESAAGIAGLIKVVLSLQHEEIPANLHFQKMNPHIDWNGLPVDIPVNARPWARGAKKRLAGVSAFGFSGTNAHVIVEEPPARAQRTLERNRPVHILAVSARTPLALQRLTERYDAALGAAGLELPDICYTANAGRIHLEQRIAVVGSTAEEVQKKLCEQKTGTQARERDGIRPAFLFSGQGSQYSGMGKQLYATQGVFRNTIDECERLLKEHLEKPLREVLWGEATEFLEQTAYTQPALFALEYALSELWRSWGVEPSVVLGHSVGEYAAACVAGVYSLADGLTLIAARARLMQQVAGQGAMVAILAGEDRVRQALQGLESRVAIAGVNAPESVVISGYLKEVSVAEERLRSAGIKMQRLAVSHGFHSPQMADMEEEFERIASEIPHAAPRIKMISSVTARELGRGETGAGDRLGHGSEYWPAYWRMQVREPVRFRAAIDALEESGQQVYLEIGPGTTLAGLGRQCVEVRQGTGNGERVWAVSLRKNREEWRQILESLGRLYEQGANVDWEEFDKGYARRRVCLPTYPFQRQRYWIEDAVRRPAKSASAPRTAGESDTRSSDPASGTVNGIVNGMLQRIADAPAEERKSRLVEYLIAAVAPILAIPAEGVDAARPLTDFGVDSLMALEFKNRINSDLGVSVSTIRFLEGVSLQETAWQIMAELPSPVAHAAHELAHGHSSRLANANSHAAGARLDALLDDLLNAPSDQRQSRLVNYLVGVLAPILGVDATTIAASRPLSDFGLDSLMALEFKNRIAADLDVTIPTVRFLEGPTLDEIASRIQSELPSTPTARPVSIDSVPALEYPLSYAQQHVWFVHKLMPDSATFNVGFTAKASPRLDWSAFERAVAKLVDRHAALRAIFVETEAGPVQRILPRSDAATTLLIDASAINEAELKDLIFRDFQQNFELDRPLFRVKVFRGGDWDVIFFKVDHLIIDNWSVQICFEDLKKLYAAELQGADAGLKPLKGEYQDFVKWEAGVAKNPDLVRQGNYWKEELGGDLPRLNIPTSRRRPTALMPRGEAIPLLLTPSLGVRIQRIARPLKVTTYTFMLAAFQVLLHRFSHQDDIIVGTSASGRENPRWSNTIGFFVNLLPMRARFPRNLSFAEHLIRSRDTVLGALKHQEFPFALMMTHLRLRRNLERTPVFQAFFNFLTDRSGEFGPLYLGVRGRTVKFGSSTLDAFITLPQQEGRTEVAVQLAEVDGEIDGYLNYNNDVIDRSTAERMAVAYRNVLDAVVGDPNLPIETLVQEADGVGSEREEIVL